MNEDDVYPSASDAEEFRSLGVLRIHGAIAREELVEKLYARRYQVAKIYESEALRSVYVVPLPTALALLIATAGFPRRGDVYKDGFSGYAAALFELIAFLVDKQELSYERNTKLLLAPKLMLAQSVLSDQTISIGSARVIAAEYIIEWADSVCSCYTFFARCAVFESFGEAGSSVSTRTAYSDLPHILSAVSPSPESIELAIK